MSNEGLISVIFDITSMKNASIHKYVEMCALMLFDYACAYILTDVQQNEREFFDLIDVIENFSQFSFEKEQY